MQISRFLELKCNNKAFTALFINNYMHAKKVNKPFAAKLKTDIKSKHLMIDYIKGQLTEITPTHAVVEAYGVGYDMAISLGTYTAIQSVKEVKLYIYEAVREDVATQLFGFAKKDERDLFLLLISVNGVGGQTARMILSAYSPSELASIIQNEDIRQLKAIKGIGPKAAQRIVVELKDKVASLIGGTSDTTSGQLGTQSVNKEVVDEAVSALTMLGFPPAPTHKTVLSIVKAEPSISVEQVIKQALKML